jgi:hypothetical protein
MSFSAGDDEGGASCEPGLAACLHAETSRVVGEQGMGYIGQYEVNGSVDLGASASRG